MASYTLQGFTDDASSPDLDATNLNEMDNAIKVGHDFADSASATPEAGKAMVWPDSGFNASTATLATQALKIKPLGNSITLPATPTSVTRIIKIATVDWPYAGSINIVCAGAGIDDVIKVYINGGNSLASGVRVLYGKNSATYGIKKIIVTRTTEAEGSDRDIYAEIKTYPASVSRTTLGVVEANRGTFTPSMTEVSSVEGTVVDSLPLDYLRGDISSYQHVFTKNIIGNLTGNADTATKADKIPFATKTGTSTGTQGQASFDASYLYLCTATNVWKRVALTSF